jgi:O-antigen/teichoic acid export membrane protein
VTAGNLGDVVGVQEQSSAPGGGSGRSSRLRRLRSSGMTRSLWNILDQVVASANNFLIQFVITHAFTKDVFGAFAIAFSVFSISTGFFRALSTSPVSMRFADADDREFHRAASSAIALTALGAAVFGAVLVLMGLLLPFTDALSHVFVALGFVLPGLMLQDAWRQVFFARLRPAAACLIDVSWVVLQLAGLGVLALVADENHISAYTAVWGGAAYLTSVIGMALLHLRPRVSGAVRWLREQYSVTRYLVPEFVIIQTGGQLAPVIAAAVTTIDAAGALRGANLVTVPATIVSTGLMSFAVPELVRRRERMDARRWELAAVVISGLVVAVSVLWGAVVLLLPTSVGELVLDDTWAGARAVLLATIVGQAGSAVTVGCAAVLYATEGAKVTMRLHLVFALFLVVLSTGGSLLYGAQGTAWGIAIAFWVVAPWWYVSVRKHVRRPVPEAPAQPVDAG